jgi:hypothetical protein
MDVGAARSIVQPLSLFRCREAASKSQQPAANKSLLDNFFFLLSAVDCRLSASLQAVGWNLRSN